MALTRERKEQLVAQYGQILTESDGFVIIESRGLTVKQVQDLRAKVREANGRYLVAKNTLFRIALNNIGWPVPDKHLNGPVSVVFGKGNFPGIAKTVLAFMKDVEATKFRVKGGVMAGSVLDAPAVQTVSTLPTLDELRAQFAGLLVQPATGLVSVFNAATGQIVNVIQAYVDKQSGNAA